MCLQDRTYHKKPTRLRALGFLFAWTSHKNPLSPARVGNWKTYSIDSNCLKCFSPTAVPPQKGTNKQTPFQRHTLQDPVLTAARRGLEEGRQTARGFFIPAQPDLLPENTAAALLPSFTLLWGSTVPAPAIPCWLSRRGAGEDQPA